MDNRYNRHNRRKYSLKVHIVPVIKYHERILFMKFHRVLLFTSIQMDITPVGDDLHVLLTCGGENRLGCTAFSTPLPDTDPVECETSVITDVENPEDLFCPYIAENLCKKTGQRVLCTGGILVEEPDAHQIDKLYENIDEMIMDWVHFLD